MSHYATRRTGRRRSPQLQEVHPEGACIPPKRGIPATGVVTENDLDLLEQHADWILKEIGVEFRGDQEVLELFRQAGASVNGERVRFDPGHAKALCRTAPSKVTLCGRNPTHSIELGGDSVCMSPGYGSPFVTDLDQGRRYATIKDFHNFVKLSQLSPWMHHSGGTVCEPVDIAVNKRHLDMVYAHLRYSTKPFMGNVTATFKAEDSIAMARIMFGKEFMKNNCVIQANINLNSPLVLDQVMSGALKTYARANQCNFVSPFLLGGAMGPVTQPALIAQAHAETIAAVALTQLVKEGSPVIYGNFLTSLDLQSGAPTFGGPEASLGIAALGQLCRRMQLPLRGIGHVTAAKSADGQAMQESADSMSAAIAAGSHIIFHAAGWLEGGLTMGYEKFMLDMDRCGMVCRQLKGLEITSEGLAKDAYQESKPGDNFLATRHTLRHFKTANYRSSVLSDTQSFEQWSEYGCVSAEQRANQAWKQALGRYEDPGIDPSIDEELRAFIEKRKNETPDQWH